MWKKITAVLLCAVMSLLVLSSCGKSEKTILLPIETEVTSCDPQIASGEGLQSLANNAYEGLVRLDKDGRVIPGVATSWNVTGGGTVYTFHLNPDARWHLPDKLEDILGDDYKRTFRTAVIADDFVFALQRAVAKNTNAPLAGSLLGIQNAVAVHNGTASPSSLGVRASGYNTVQITLSAPDANFLSVLASAPCMPCHRTFFEATAGRYGLKSTLLLCNGPYYLSGMNPASGSLALTKNPDYTGSYPALADNLKFVMAQDLGGGSGSSASPTDGVVTLDILSSVTGDDGLNAGVVKQSETTNLAKKYEVTPYQNQVKVLCFNQRNDFPKNGHLRMAMTYATDPSQISDISSNAATGIVPDCTVTTPGHPYRSQAGRVILGKPNLEKAKAHFNALNPLDFAPEEDGSKLKTDEVPDLSISLTLACLSSDKSYVQTLMQNWQKVFGTSLSITIETYGSQNTLDKVLKKGDYDIAYTSVRTDSYLTDNFLNKFTSGNAENFLGLNDASYDALAAAVSSATSDKEIAKRSKAAEQYLLGHGYIIPLRQETNCLVTNKAGRDVFVTPAGCIYSAFSLPEND